MPIKTTKKQIAKWGASNLNELNMGADAADFLTHCWRCGHDNEPTERCHVIPDALGGEDVSSNFRLLCKGCHLEAPNVNDPKAMDEWIKTTKLSGYNVFWNLRKIINEVYGEVTHHWGEEINQSTSNWAVEKIYKRAIKEINNGWTYKLVDADTKKPSLFLNDLERVLKDEPIIRI